VPSRSTASRLGRTRPAPALAAWRRGRSTGAAAQRGAAPVNAIGAAACACQAGQPRRRTPSGSASQTREIAAASASSCAPHTTALLHAQLHILLARRRAPAAPPASRAPAPRADGAGRAPRLHALDALVQRHLGLRAVLEPDLPAAPAAPQRRGREAAGGAGAGGRGGGPGTSARTNGFCFAGAVLRLPLRLRARGGASAAGLGRTGLARARARQGPGRGGARTCAP
jgi:hypothetical protein